MNTAFAAAFAGADPPAGSFIRACSDLCTGIAAQRAVTLAIKGIDIYLIQGQVLPDLPFIPDQDGVEFEQTPVAFFDLLEVCSSPAFRAA